jgi:hypothetical protein
MSKKNRKNQQPQKNKNLVLDYDKALKSVKSEISRIDKKIIKSVPKGIQYDWLNNTSFNNVIYPKDKIPDSLLRLVEKKNGIVGSIITLRIQQALEFSNISYDKDVPGWEMILKDREATITPEQEKQKRFLESFFSKTHREDYESFETQIDDFRSMFTKYVRDRILIDKVCWEIERDKAGRAMALWVLDGATILPVLPGGFYGSMTQIGFGISNKMSSVSEEIRKARLANVPPVEEISYVQELFYGSSTGGGIAAAFREDDIIYDLANELNDIRYYKQGISVTEKANLAITAFINSLTFNSHGLARGAIPKIAIAMGKDSGYNTEELEDAQDEWAANFSSMDGQWNIPLLNGDAKVLQLLPNARDMEYQKYMEFTGALICSIMGVDASELGLRLNQAQAVLSENQDAKQLFSKNRGVRDMLGGFAYIANKFLDISGYSFARDWTFKFNGIDTTDKGFEADLRKKDVETYKTVNELRAELDMKPIEGGDILLNPAYLQAKQLESMGGGGASSDGGEEEDLNFSDEDIEDVMSMQKAIRLI